MSGHSKWSTIKHKKAATDAKRGKIFSRVAREIMVAAREGGGDPEANITLRSLVQKARGYNMPADNIDRAIKKGTGELAGEVIEEIAYEGYAAGGVAVIVEVMTDNRNRSAAEVRHLFTRHGVSMAQQGSVSRGFRRKGQLAVPADAIGEDRLMELVLEAGAEDLVREGDDFIVTTEPAAYAGVAEALRAAGVEPTRSEVTLLPDVYTPVGDRKQAAALLRFTEALEDLDDVQNVFTSADIDEALVNELSEE